MRALVIWESVFGNTRKIADAIVDGLGPAVTAAAVEADHVDAWLLDSVDMVVVGAPTHMFGLPSARSRQGSARQATGKADDPGRGVREWLAGSPKVSPGTLAAAFDTRFAKPHWITGSAARGMTKRLTTLGYMVIATESFFVARAEGPLLTGEVERAREWAARLATELVSVEN
jgi:flavodoxin-like protein